MGCTVTPEKKYREFADECVGWAKTAKSDREREIFLQMAQAWAQAATTAALRSDEVSDREPSQGASMLGAS